MYTELFLLYCITKNVNLYQSKVHYEQDHLEIIFEDDTRLFKSAEVSKYFDNLEKCHNANHELHGYDGFYKATFEYVLAHIMNNLIERRIPKYNITWEQEFYKNSFDFLNNFIRV